MPKVRTLMASVGIEAAVRPICCKERARADNIFPFYFFIDHDHDREKVFPYVMHESHTQIIRSGTVVGHHASCIIAPEINYLQKK